jgi:hypothetical protein
VSQTVGKQSDKKKYIRPEVTIVRLDNHISLVMMTPGPPNPPPRGPRSQTKGTSDGPFASPFGDKAFE